MSPTMGRRRGRRRQQQQASIRGLNRRIGAKSVAAVIGIGVDTLAKFLVGADVSADTLASIDLAFEQLGPHLGLEPWRARYHRERESEDGS
jgi:hypothetical protein